VEINIGEQLSFEGRVNFDNQLPLPYQRFHFANNFQWKLDELITQQLLNIQALAVYGKKQFIQAKLNWTTVSNGLFFMEEEWRQDFGVVSAGDLTLSSRLNWKSLYFYPSVTLRLNTENYAYQPALSTRNRISFKKGFFENESLILAFGTDIGYDVGHQHLMYNPVLNTMDMTSIENTTPNLLRLNIFAAMEIDQFRMFVRAENVDYFINDQKARMDPHYTLMPFIIRIGITWDFFN
jgi:hypothetical protein